MNFYFVVIGATPKGRLIEQHDVFFGMAEKLKDLTPQMEKSWPETNGRFHIDTFRKIEYVENYKIEIVEKGQYKGLEKLFFINLGGYLPNDMEEYHYKTLFVAKTKAEAIKKAKETEFYKKFSFKSAESHVDDQFWVDVDDIYKIDDILLPEFKENYSISILPFDNAPTDKFNVGYLSLAKLEKSEL